MSKNYQLLVDVKYEPDDNGKVRRYMYCPICNERYQQFLLCFHGLIGCNACMGGRLRDRIERVIRHGGAVIVDGIRQRVDMELARLLGLR